MCCCVTIFSHQVLRGSTDDADGPIWPSVSTPAPRQRPQQAAESLATPAGRPDMGDMLRDIGSVKLRTVHAAKSPGGTPLRPNKGKKEADPNDPASIIAHALRKKFSHRVFKDSPGWLRLPRTPVSVICILNRCSHREYKNIMCQSGIRQDTSRAGGHIFLSRRRVK